MRRTAQKIEPGAPFKGRAVSGPAPPGERLIVIALCGMVSAVPLVYWQGIYDYFLLPKLFMFYLCLALACLGWLLQTLRNGSPATPNGSSIWRDRSSVPEGWGIRCPLLLPALCLMGAALLSSQATTHFLDTLVELTNQAALLVLLFVAARAFPPTRLRPVLWSSALTGLTVALIGILQYHGLDVSGIPSNAPPSATFANRNLAAEYLICAIPLAALLFLTARRRVALLLSGLSAALMGVFLVYTRTRAAWVGAAGALLGLGAVLVLWPGLRRLAQEAVGGCVDRGKGRMGVGLLLLFLLLSALPPLPSALERQPHLPEGKAGVISTAASVFQREAMRDASITQRLAFWRGTLRLVADHPLLGVGPGGWVRAYPPYDRGATITPEGYHRRPHNDYLWIASEYGLLGLGVYLWLLIVAFKCLLDAARGPDRPSRVAAWMFGLSLLSILGAAFFGFPKEQPQTALFPYLLIGLAAGATERRRIRLRARASGLALLAGLLLVSLLGLELTRRRIAFDRYYLRAFSYGVSAQNWPAVLAEAQRAQEYGVFRSDLLFFKGLALQNLRRYSEAEAAYRQTLSCAPHAWYAHDSLGFVHLHQGRLQEGLAHCQKALSLCPSATYIHTNMGVIYQQMGDPEQAEREFRAVLRTVPNDLEAHLNLGSLYRLRGQPDSSIAHYEQALLASPEAPQARLILAQAYAQQGRLRDALPHYQRAIQAYPDNPDARWGLGLSLEADGHLQEAADAYRKVIALRPDFAQAHLALGNVGYAQRNYRAALNAYRSFLHLSQGDTTHARFAREQIARCEEQVKK